MSNIIAQLEAEQMNREIPAFAPGDTVIVQVKVKEGDRQRLQAFEGVVIGKRNRGLNSAFTVRKISSGVGVERTFQRSEERRVGKECRSRWSPEHEKKNRWIKW